MCTLRKPGEGEFLWTGLDLEVLGRVAYHPIVCDPFPAGPQPKFPDSYNYPVHARADWKSPDNILVCLKY